jgi:hypothetical protein
MADGTSFIKDGFYLCEIIYRVAGKHNCNGWWGFFRTARENQNECGQEEESVIFHVIFWFFVSYKTEQWRGDNFYIIIIVSDRK